MLVIIGCGNLNRSDDGVGVVVVHRLRERLGDALPAGVRLVDAGTDGMAVMFQARGATALVVVDASRSGSEPGAVFEVPGDVLAAPPEPGLGLHGFRWDHALYAGRRILREAFPTDVRVVLVEAGSLDLGTALTPAVDAAAERVVDLLGRRIGDG